MPFIDGLPNGGSDIVCGSEVENTLNCYFALLLTPKIYASSLRLTRIITPSSNYLVIKRKIGLLILVGFKLA